MSKLETSPIPPLVRSAPLDQTHNVIVSQEPQWDNEGGFGGGEQSCSSALVSASCSGWVLIADHVELRTPGFAVFIS